MNEPDHFLRGLTMSKQKQIETIIDNWIMNNKVIRFVGNNGELRNLTQKSITELSKEILGSLK